MQIVIQKAVIATLKALIIKLNEILILRSSNTGSFILPVNIFILHMIKEKKKLTLK